ncbi:DNA polymerase III subunit beta [Paenibacillus cymbidii]|uniref:DNA polymerase III subunit beta n=1 Tax=Paenibacillus cymbidii TaxID=1639034 RepID=UPI0014368666|nr:DNA polymerase III subunit beta [Paenibacillus cymbidii]
MKFQIEKSRLLPPLTQAVKAASAKGTIPILDGVLIQAETDKLRITGGNLEMFVIASFEREDCQVERFGAAVIAANKIHDIISKMPDALITIDVVDNRATISTGKTKIVCGSEPADLYPELPHAMAEAMITMQAKAFKDLVNLSAYAVSKDERLPALCGVYIASAAKKIRFMAADKKSKMAHVSDDIDSDVEMNVLVSGPVLKDIAKLIRDDVSFSVTRSWFVLHSGSIVVYSRIIETAYPVETIQNLNKFKEKTMFRLKTKEFISAVELTLLAAENDEISIKATAEGVSVSATTGNAEDFVSVQEFTGEMIPITVNGDLFLESLHAIENDEFRIRLQGPGKLIIMSGDDEENSVFATAPLLTRGGEKA